jgi:hypothetical protein
MQHDRLDVVIRGRGRKSLAALAAEVGLPARYAADLSRIARGLHVKPDRRREIGRAFGTEPPPRTVQRLTVPKHLRPLVDAARQAGRSTEDILLRGLQEGER